MTAGPRMGFFTDTSICIGCKACEVACKEWNLVPQDAPLSLSGNSYDNTMALGAAGAALVLAGSMCERWAVYKAGFQSARDPRYIVEPQRAHLAEREREQLQQ